ncbi:MAG TPA: permease-like cell division protein FtsX [Bacteroidales bacterium]|nr:permease-like cell division protein FtsX [Bacteroidales bacterium]HRR48476.1 permease-like cell division protein FtsX [Bacteroidales bacterium]HRT32917.1 permease-like cell division protein FtsX [Bacteroidales bacterium]HRT83045.1 permease-like cell division protein FtsX [Bacteroidales bacterium]
MKKKEKGIIFRRLVHSYLSSIISISLVLLIVGFLGIIAVNAKAVSDYFKENIRVSVMFDKNASNYDALDFLSKVQGKDYIKRAEFISKERGAEEMKNMLGEDFLYVFDFNPIPLSVDIYLKADYLQSDSLKTIVSELSKWPKVREIAYQESLVSLINQNLEKVGIILSVILILLLFISFVLINNTVRLNIYSKRFTIQTMKLVGAKRSFIRKPFIKQAVFQGLISGTISAALLSVLVLLVKRDINQLFLIFDIKMIALVIFGVILAGIFICVISTRIVVNKLLSVSADELYY